MSRRLVCFILATIMTLCLSVPAFAEGEMDAPPPPEVVEDAPSVGETPPMVDEAILAEGENMEDVAAEVDATEEPPVEGENVNDGIMTVAAEPMPITSGGVTVILDGIVDAVSSYFYDGPDGKIYETRPNGTSYQPHPFDYGDNTPIYVEYTDTLRTQVTVAAGDTVRVWLEDATHDITVDNGTITDNHINTFISSQRCVDILCPESGTVTIHITGTDKILPELIPFTFYNKDWTNCVVVGGGMVVSGKEANSRYAFGHTDNYDVVYTDSAFEEWVAPGYEIQVLEGGYVAEKRAPTGPAAKGMPTGTTCYVLHVDLGAKAFTIACVKQGETFAVPDDSAPQTEAPPADTTKQTGSTFTDVADGVWYADPIQKAYSSGIVKGVTDTTFAPNGTTTRGQTVTMLYRAMGSPGGSNVFSDTTGEVASAAGWASGAGVTNGVSATAFSPNSSVTREQLVTMLYRLAGSPTADTSVLASYTDGGSVQSYAQRAVAWAISNGLLAGYGDGTIRPAATANRAEVCTLIVRYLGV